MRAVKDASVRGQLGDHARRRVARERVALVGTSPPGWHSLARTCSFFRKAVHEQFSASEHDSFPLPQQVVNESDAIIALAPAVGSRAVPRSGPAVLYSTWGGAVLDYDMLCSVAGNFSARERLIVSCESDLDVLVSMPGGHGAHCEILPLPVDTSVFHPVERAAAKAQLGLAASTVLIGYVARLIPEKNAHLVLRMLAELRSRPETANVLLLIVGDFWVDYPILQQRALDYRAHLVHLAEELGVAKAVKLLPASLTGEQLNTFYNAVDLLVHPTMCVDENFGYVPLEAMACGTPVVGTAYGGLKDTVAGSGCGFLQPTWITAGGIRTDWRQMVATIARLLTSSQLRQRMSSAAIARINDEFSFRTAASRLRDIILRAIHEEPVGRRATAFRSRAIPCGPTARVNGLGERWSRMVKPVTHYVSDATPDVNDASYVYAYCRYEIHGAQRVRLDDALWPVEYLLSEAQIRALRRIGEGCPCVRDLLTDGVARSDVQHLVELGVLVVTDKVYRLGRAHG